MTNVAFETAYGINVSGVVITQWPRVASITFDHDGIVYRLWFSDPLPFASATEALVECYQIRILDRKPKTQQDFGRYLIEIHGEDGCYADFQADSYEHISIGKTPAGQN